MASMPMSDPQQQGSPAPPPDAGGATPSPQGGGQQPPPSSAPANPMQMLLAKWYQAAKEVAQSDSRLASGAAKVLEGIQEMQTALISPQQPSPSQQPQY